MRNYRNSFIFAVACNIALIGILGGLWWRSAQHKKTEATMPSASDEGAQNAPNGSESASTAPHETSLVPVQFSPERMQSIGVRMGRVERKMVGDEIRATGNVAVDETKLAYVQVRYSGYIQEVFADATYQYLRKGQSLFTIYSPDLAATGARTARIHGPSAAGTSSRFSRLRLHHRAERFAESHRAAGDAALFRRRSLNRLDFRRSVSERSGKNQSWRPGKPHRGHLPRPQLRRPCELHLSASGYDDTHGTRSADFPESRLETHARNVRKLCAPGACWNAARDSRQWRPAIRHTANRFRESRRRLSRTARSRTRSPRGRKLRHLEGIE